jgi:serine/threonine-protein kinase
VSTCTATGQILADRYLLGERLGSGGMARVYLAHDRVLDRPVAVKMLHDDLVESEDVRARFLREARIFARLEHPNIVKIHDVVARDEGVAMVMELVDGVDLSKAVRTRLPMSTEHVVGLLRPVLDALAAAHAQGVVHRDVKPGDVLLGRDGRVKLSDFGITKVVGGDTHLTRTGEFLGTPTYIAPEQATGEDFGPAVDQYALGVTFFELLTGRPPYIGPTPLAVLSAILRGGHPDLRSLNERIPEPVASVVGRMLARAPADRFPSLEAAGEAFDQVMPAWSATRLRAFVSALAEGREPVEVAPPTSSLPLDAPSSKAAEAPPVPLSVDTPSAGTGVFGTFPGAPVPRSGPPARVYVLGAAVLALLLGLALWWQASRRGSEPQVAQATARPAPPAPDMTPSVVSNALPSLASPTTAAPTLPWSAAAPESVAAARPAPPPRKGGAPSRAPASSPAVAPAPPATEPPAPAAPASAVLEVVTFPWAEVYVDGKHLGRTPYLKRLELPAGKRKLRLVNPGLRPDQAHEETVELGEGKTTQRRVRL